MAEALGLADAGDTDTDAVATRLQEAVVVWLGVRLRVKEGDAVGAGVADGLGLELRDPEGLGVGDRETERLPGEQVGVALWETLWERLKVEVTDEERLRVRIGDGEGVREGLRLGLPEREGGVAEAEAERPRLRERVREAVEDGVSLTTALCETVRVRERVPVSSRDGVIDGDGDGLGEGEAGESVALDGENREWVGEGGEAVPEQLSVWEAEALLERVGVRCAVGLSLRLRERLGVELKERVADQGLRVRLQVVADREAEEESDALRLRLQVSDRLPLRSSVALGDAVRLRLKVRVREAERDTLRSRVCEREREPVGGLRLRVTARLRLWDGVGLRLLVAVNDGVQVGLAVGLRLGCPVADRDWEANEADHVAVGVGVTDTVAVGADVDVRERVGE